jgi:GDP-L-fucose synthase
MTQKALITGITGQDGAYLAIQINLLHAAYKYAVKRLLFLGSSCIYPKFAPQPMMKEHLLTGPLEPTNRPYAQAKIAGRPTVTVRGTGMPRREFMYSEDMADACVFPMSLPDGQFVPLLGQDRNDGLPPRVNIGVGEDLTIAELASLVKKVTGYAGEIVFDTAKPDGTPRKLLNVSRLRELGWQPLTNLESGLRSAQASFVEMVDRPWPAGK